MNPGAEDDEEDLPAEYPLPEYHMSDADVEGLEIEYSTRAPDDWVLSGPLGGHGGGPGRRFPNWKAAEAFARGLHGNRVKGRIPDAAIRDRNRWAFLIAAKK